VFDRQVVSGGNAGNTGAADDNVGSLISHELHSLEKNSKQ
jgi:hypothetical protein